MGEQSTWKLTLRLHIITFSFAYFSGTYLYLSFYINFMQKAWSRVTLYLCTGPYQFHVRSTTWSCCANSDGLIGNCSNTTGLHRKLVMSSSSCLMWVLTESQQVSLCNSRVLARLTTSSSYSDSYIPVALLLDSLVLPKTPTLMVYLEQSYQIYIQTYNSEPCRTWAL